MAVALGPIAKRLLAAKKPRAFPPVVPAALKRILAEHGVPGHKPALAFERAYAGPLFKDWLLGPANCLGAGIAFEPPGTRKLVPVLFTDNDNHYFLAADGTAWAQDTIEDPSPVPFAKNARTMLTKVLVQEHAFESPDAKAVTLPGAHGARVAKALGAARLDEASDKTVTWWTDGRVFIVERDGETRVMHAAKPQLALSRTTAGIAAPVKKAPGTTFEEVMNEGAAMCVVIPDLPGTPAENYASFLPIAKRRGTVTALAPGVRIALDVAGDRVEIFFRKPLVSTLVNIYQFTKKRVAAEKAWRAVAEPWAASRR